MVRLDMSDEVAGEILGIFDGTIRINHDLTIGVDSSSFDDDHRFSLSGVSFVTRRPFLLLIDGASVVRDPPPFGGVRLVQRGRGCSGCGGRQQ